ncbi:uncharacterized protein LOC134721331 [Mytilus trossulus]|uniref:uncharacterized protein LOC134721331 n=1 Tax=Mytilus trossulus TaxID=6551 RepID=UPI0030068F2A
MEAKLQPLITLCVILLVDGAVLNRSIHDQLQDNGLTNTKVQAFGRGQTHIAPRLDKTPLFNMFYTQPFVDPKSHLDQLHTNQRTYRNEYYWNSIFNSLFRDLMSELRQNANPANILTNLNEEQAPVINHRYEVSIIDPRTINRKKTTNNFDKPTQKTPNPPSPVVNAVPIERVTNLNEELKPFIKHQNKVSKGDPRNGDQESSIHSVNQPVSNIDHAQSTLIDHKTIESVPNLNDLQASIIKHRYKVSIDDPRTSKQKETRRNLEKPGSIIDHPQSTINDHKTIESFPNLNDLPAPIIKRRYKVSMVDPRTIKQKEVTRNLDKPGSIIDHPQSTVNDPKTVESFPKLNDLPAPIIKRRYEVSMVDPRTIKQKETRRNLDKPGSTIDQMSSSVDPTTIGGLTPLNEVPMIEHQYKATIIDPRTIERTFSKQKQDNKALMMQKNPTTADNFEKFLSLWSSNSENIPFPLINNQKNPFRIYQMPV